MPRWEVHLTVGLAAAAMVAFGFLMGSLGGGGTSSPLSATMTHLLPMSLGALGLVAGSLLPDLDGKGIVRWFVGPLAGAMVLAPPLADTTMDGNFQGGIRFLGGDGAKLFLLSCALGYMLLLVPFRHRGFLHTHTAGLLFGTAWGAYLLSLPMFDPASSLLAGAMGYLGYCWHLALDGRL